MKAFKLLVVILLNLSLAYLAFVVLIVNHIQHFGLSLKSLFIFCCNIVIARFVSR